MAREDDDASIWARLHARQALVLGVLATLGFFIVLALPLAAVVVIPGLSADATIVVYLVGLCADAAVGVGFALLAFRCAARAARGELFSLPLVTPIVDRVFRLDRD